jgi:hypothetical protein
MRIRKKIARLAAAALVAGAAVFAVGLASATPAQAATPVEIVGQGSGKCLDLRHEDGRTVQTWTCFGSPNQRWYVQFAGTYSGTNWFRFVSADVPTQCMTVHGGGFANGTPVEVADCGGGDTTQMFRLESIAGTSAMHLHPFYTSKCIDVSGNSTANGAKVQLWDCNGTTAQRFAFA